MSHAEEEFPEFYASANAHSRRWQTRYIWSQKIQLTCLLLAAGAALVEGGLLVAELLFLTAAGTQLFRYATSADEKWWNGRAGAESAKTLSWRYISGGAPFSVGDADSDSRLVDRLSEVAVAVAKMAPIAITLPPITDGMRARRAEALDVRVQRYLVERIRDQMQWYGTKSKFNERRAFVWTMLAVSTQVGALIVGAILLAGDWHVDLIGLLAAASASAVGWMAIRQYEVLARSYAVASRELAKIDAKITSQNWDETSWSIYVADAEEAISREHTSWRASRGLL